MTNGDSISLRVAVIDLETGGLDPQSDPILQMALVGATVAGAGVVIDHEWSTMVRLPRPWSPYGARHIHGIKRRQLLLAPSAATALSRLSEQCGDRTIVAHNLAFDWGFLEVASERTGVALPAGRHICTLSLSRALDPKRTQSHRLTDIAQRHGIENERAHDALSDARTAAAILPFLLGDQGSQR